VYEEWVSTLFRKFAQIVSHWVGTPMAFGFALLTVVIWGFLGPVFGFSDTWQLVINTGTTIVTFLMVFLIQNTQNREGRATQLKLDELIRANKAARNQMINLESLSDEQLDKVHEEFVELHNRFSERLQEIEKHKSHRRR
jgi:low affinity Fe/Cu permease